MNSEINFKNGYSTISTNGKELSKSFEMLTSDIYAQTVEIGRLPSKSTIVSLPKEVEKVFIAKRDRKSRRRDVILSSIIPKSTSSFKLPPESHIDTADSIQRYATVSNIDLVSTLEQSKRTYLMKKLKDSILYPLFKSKKATKNNKPLDLMLDLFNHTPAADSEKHSPESVIIDSPVLGSPNADLHRGVTCLGGKSYYQRNGTYYDINDSEYQLAHPKTSQTVKSRGLIESVLDPEAIIIPIRKDTTSDGLQCLSGGKTKYTLIEEIHSKKPTLLIDAGSSSLNLSSTDNSGDSASDSYDNTTEGIGSISHSSNGVNIYNSDFEEDLEHSDTDNNNATTTMPTRTTTRAATIIVPHTGLLATSSDSGTPGLSETLPANPPTAHSALSGSYSSSSGSYCSILQSPIHLIKNPQEAAERPTSSR